MIILHFSLADTLPSGTHWLDIIDILINFFIIIIFIFRIRGRENVIIAKLLIKDLEMVLSFSLFLVLLLILLLKVFYWFR